MKRFYRGGTLNLNVTTETVYRCYGDGYPTLEYRGVAIKTPGSKPATGA